jgi:hypothetical protein
VQKCDFLTNVKGNCLLFSRLLNNNDNKSDEGDYGRYLNVKNQYAQNSKSVHRQKAGKRRIFACQPITANILIINTLTGRVDQGLAEVMLLRAEVMPLHAKVMPLQTEIMPL